MTVSPLDLESLANWAALERSDAQVLAAQYHHMRVRVAREDVNEFVELVGRDEETGEPLVQAPIHEEFQRLAAKHNRLVLWSHVESGKTSQLSILRVLWMLGRDPTLRIAIISRTQTQAVKLVKAIQRYIEHSPELHEVFPELKPGDKWTDAAFTVARGTYGKDYSLQALGIGTAVLGARLDGVVMDDVLDWENTRTAAQRLATSDWYKKQIGGRLTRKAWVHLVGNAWHPDDFLHTQARNPAWAAYRFPVTDPATNALRWPERWSRERIEAFTTEYGPDEAARQLHCKTRDDDEARFRRAWIDACLSRGEGRELPFMLHSLPPGYRTFTGVDLGTRENKKSDLTVLFTICVHPDGSREVLCIESGRWSGPEIVQRIGDSHARFHSVILVENNAAQDFIRQFVVADSAIPILPFSTGANKWHPEFGVESIAVEMFNAKWIIPARGGQPLSKELAAWIAEMLYYSPDAHTGDRLMACWFAREGTRQKKKQMRGRRVDLHSR